MNTTTGNLKHRAAAAKTADLVAQLRDDITRQLQVLVDLNTTLEDLASTHQSIGPGFMTPDARAAADKRATTDRGIARGAGRIATVGLGWLNATQLASPAGATKAPVTIAAVSTSAEILFALQHHVRRLAPAALELALRADAGVIGELVHLELEDDARGWCEWPRTSRPQLHPLTIDPPTTDGDVADLAGHLTRLVEHYTNRRGLEALLRDLDHLEEKARDVVDGPAKTNHDGPCPWCGQPTLVVHHRDAGRDVQLIRCEGDHRCECTWEWCDCHRNPIRNRHEWINSGRASHTWTELLNLQTKRKELTILETKALDALQQIRALHQPFWLDRDGERHSHTVQIPGDEIERVAPDHVCIEIGFDRCEIEPDDPAASLHSVPACTECQITTDDGAAGYLVWPCRTYRATDIDTPDSPNREENTR